MRKKTAKGIVTTGYYGLPGKVAKGKVHFVVDGHPLCGYLPSKEHVFQWCAWGYHTRYCECDNCMAKYFREKK